MTFLLAMKNKLHIWEKSLKQKQSAVLWEVPCGVKTFTFKIVAEDEVHDQAPMGAHTALRI